MARLPLLCLVAPALASPSWPLGSPHSQTILAEPTAGKAPEDGQDLNKEDSNMKSEVGESEDQTNEEPAARVCDLSLCRPPDCHCGGEAPQLTIPMMVTLTFHGPVTDDNMLVYDRLFNGGHMSPSNCSSKATFFVSHQGTNYSAVQELHRKGHEIGVGSITNKDDPKYWSEGETDFETLYDLWLAEMAGSRLIIERFANITDSSINGMRSPSLTTGGDQQFKMMHDQYFPYDSSMVVPLSEGPMWPYTLEFRMPHTCTSGNCPRRSWWGLWEVPINELEVPGEPGVQGKDTGCRLVSSCSAIQTTEQFRNLLDHNLQRHYTTNRAPLSLSFDPSWLVSNQGFTEVLEEWMTSVSTRYNDVYFVTELQVIQWIQEKNIENPWNQEKCDVKGKLECEGGLNLCNLTTRELPGEQVLLSTCAECPSSYPSIMDPSGDGFNYCSLYTPHFCWY